VYIEYGIQVAMLASKILLNAVLTLISDFLIESLDTKDIIEIPNIIDAIIGKTVNPTTTPNADNPIETKPTATPIFKIVEVSITKGKSLVFKEEITM
jgi:hypothetical protein